MSDTDNYGWLTADGRIIECGRYGHGEALWDLYYPHHDKVLAYEACQSLANSGEHPEWHIFEMTEGPDYYEDGHCRFGTYRNRFGDRIVEIEGAKRPPTSKIDELVAQYGCHGFTFTERTWGKTMPAIQPEPEKP